jgi:hypothetical protein
MTQIYDNIIDAVKLQDFETAERFLNSLSSQEKRNFLYFQFQNFEKLKGINQNTLFSFTLDSFRNDPRNN